MRPPPKSEPASQPLSLEGFIEPDDQGLSLDDLGQAYAALLSQGADPYPQPFAEPSPAQQSEMSALDEPLPVVEGQDDAACEITPKSILESMLFVGHPTGQPLASERIAALMRGVRAQEIDDLVRELNSEFAADGCPYTIASVDVGYQLVLKPEFAGLRDAFYGRVREAKLNQAAIDVLAIVAYQQPITQVEIERLRDKPTGAILSQLVRRDLLVLQRPAEKQAKPVYRTTERFLDLFDLDELADLPRSQEMGREVGLEAD
ncbi:MAG: SMC-Scp complex subunit ScpB [Pirellulaceae bacterium]|nr:SMC-Scp complex subunit ScpB [Pirellulaceae bacterium]